MDFALNDEQLEYKERCRTFAREVIRPAARKHDEEESTPWEVIKEARKQGFGGLEAIQRSAADERGPDAGDLGRRVPLGLRRHRPGDLAALALPRRESPPPARLSRSPAGSLSASAAATRSSSAPTPSPSRRLAPT